MGRGQFNNLLFRPPPPPPLAHHVAYVAPPPALPAPHYTLQGDLLALASGDAHACVHIVRLRVEREGIAAAVLQVIRTGDPSRGALLPTVTSMAWADCANGNSAGRRLCVMTGHADGTLAVWEADEEAPRDYLPAGSSKPLLTYPCLHRGKRAAAPPGASAAATPLDLLSCPIEVGRAAAGRAVGGICDDEGETEGQQDVGLYAAAHVSSSSSEDSSSFHGTRIPSGAARATPTLQMMGRRSLGTGETGWCLSGGARGDDTRSTPYVIRFLPLWHRQQRHHRSRTEGEGGQGQQQSRHLPTAFPTLTEAMNAECVSLNGCDLRGE